MKIAFPAMPVALLLGCGALLITTAFTPALGTLTFQIKGMDNSKGVVRVVLYNNEKTFLTKNGFAAADSAFAQANSTVEVTFHSLPFGAYAVAYYQDENQNGVIDQNMLRVPTEPYAFSNGVRAKWNVPKFEEVAFQFNQSNVRVEATLRKWSDQ